MGFNTDDFGIPINPKVKKDIKSIKTRLDRHDLDLGEKANKVNCVYVSDFQKNNETDTLAIKNAVASMTDWDVLVFEANRSYSITETIFIGAYRSIQGNGCIWQSELTGVYTNGYLLSINSSQCTLYQWDKSYPLPGAYVDNIRFQGRNGSTTTNGIFCASNVKLRNHYFHYLAVFIQTSYQYLDQIEWNTINGGTRTNTSVYCLDTGFSGDLRIIESVGVGGVNALLVGNSHKAVNINRFIGGAIDIGGGSLVKVSNSHFTQDAQVKIQQNASVVFDNCHFMKHSTAPQFFITNSTNMRHANLVLKNCRFVYALYLATYNNSSNYYEVYIDSNCLCDVLIENCSKYNGSPGDSSKGIYYGIKTNINNFSLSGRKNSLQYKSQMITQEKQEITCNYSSTSIITSGGSAVDSAYEYNGTDGTYYYTGSLLLDTTRKLGKHGSTTGISLSPSASGGAARININDNAFNVSNCDLIIYRGTINGTWTEYCIVSPHDKYVIDSGYMVGCNIWMPCNEFDTLNTCSKIETDGTNVVAYMTAIPTLGSWAVSDRIVNTAPSAGGYMGWICTIAGTMGTLNSGATTGSIITGTTSLTVNSGMGLYVGCYITIVGITGVKKVTVINGTTITIDSNADTTVTNATIAFSVATFKGYGTIAS